MSAAAHVKVGDLVVLADRGRSPWTVTACREPTSDSVSVTVKRGKYVEIREYWRHEDVEAKD